jgi:hypothetical protein
MKLDEAERDKTHYTEEEVSVSATFETQVQEVERGATTMESDDEQDRNKGELSSHKRKLGEQNWKRNVTKNQREHGHEYNGRSKTNTETPARSIGQRCTCSHVSAFEC